MPGLRFDYDTAHTIAECIAALPEQSRYILYLKYRHGYTNKEIASALRISEANAVKRIQRAKDKLDALCREGGVL